MSAAESKALLVPQVMERLAVSRRTVYYMVADGRLQGSHVEAIGPIGTMRITEESVVQQERLR